MSVEVVAREVQRMADLAWAAGLLEVRGLFVVVERWRSNGRVEFEPRLRVVYKRWERPAMDRLRRTLGGSFGQPRGWVRQQWQITGARGVLEAGSAVLPYMTAEKGDPGDDEPRAADLVRLVRVSRRIVEYKRASFEERRIPDEELDVRRQLAGNLLRVQRPENKDEPAPADDGDDPDRMPF